MTEIRIPNESDAYREARNELLEAEKELRAQIENLAAQRRNLPDGGALKENYVFEELVDGKVVETKLSDLFNDGQDTLFIYSFMHAPSMDAPCTGCASLLDGLNGQMPQIDRVISTAVVAKHDIEEINDYAKSRDWKNLRLLSWKNNTYGIDYYGEIDGRQMTNVNVFRRSGNKVNHFWNSELSFHPFEKTGHPRHFDLAWPLWGVLDMTPGGRGDDMPNV